MAFTFDTAAFPDVRAVIGQDIDDVILPDTTLARSIYQGEAERFILRVLPQPGQHTGVYAAAAQYIATLYLAYLVAPTLKTVTSERFAGGSISYGNVDYEALAKRLLEMANSRVADILNATGTTPDTSPGTAFFTKAPRDFSGHW